MTRIMICDDEPKMAADIAELAGKQLPDAQLSVFTAGSDMLDALAAGGADILLLDIDMPGLSGLDIAQRLSGMPVKPLLIFVTGHDELVYDSLQFHPFGFVRKSFLEAELTKALADAVTEINGRDRHFRFHSAAGDVRIAVDDILYFESDGNYIRLFAADGEYRFRDTVTSLENTLSGSGFVRIHKGFLVNQSAVRMVSSDECVLENGTRLPVGRSYSDTARKQIMRYMLR